MKSSLVVPKSIKAGDNIGICTPSIPGYALSNEVFENGLRNLEKEGFKYKLGLAREWQENAGWKVLNQGEVEAEIVVCNLNTLMSSAGTPYFPDLEGRVLLIEEMYAPMSRQERSLMQLRLMGVFDKISGLIIGKPEQLVLEEAPFGFEELILEVVGERGYPIISNFDCSHTIPMHTIRQHSIISFKADKDFLEYIEVK